MLNHGLTYKLMCTQSHRTIDILNIWKCFEENKFRSLPALPATISILFPLLMFVNADNQIFNTFFTNISLISSNWVNIYYCQCRCI